MQRAGKKLHPSNWGRGGNAMYCFNSARVFSIASQPFLVVRSSPHLSCLVFLQDFVLMRVFFVLFLLLRARQSSVLKAGVCLGGGK